MDSTKYISHVGRLAVAVGLGAAVATGHGTAWADPATTSSSDSAKSDDSAGPDKPAASGGLPNSPTSTGSSHPGDDEDTSPSSETTSTKTTSTNTTSTKGTTTKRTSTSTTHTATPDVAEPDEAPTTAPEADMQPTAEPETVPTEPPAPAAANGDTHRPTATVTTGKNPSAVQAAVSAPAVEPAAQRSSVAAPVTDSATQEAPAPSSAQAVAPAVAATTAGATTAAAATATTTTATPSVLATAARVVNVVLAAFGLASTPTPAPADPPGLSAIFAFIRREFQRVFNNTTPSAHPQQYTESDTGVITGTIGATDPDGETLTYKVTGAPTRGAVTVAADGTYTYTPGDTLAATGGTDSFTVVVSDAGTSHWHGLLGFFTPGGGHTKTVVVPVTVTPIATNGAPSATVRIDAVDAGSGQTTGAVVGSDPDGDTVTYTRSSDPVHGTATVNADGSFTYTPTPTARHDAAAEGSTVTGDSFTVEVADGRGGVVSTLVTVTIPAVNTAPTITSAGTRNSDGTTTYAVTTADSDGDTVTVATSTPAHGSIVKNADGTWTYTPDPGYAHQLAAGGLTNTGSDTVIFTATDGHHGSAATTVTPSITPTDQAPSIAVTKVQNSNGTTTLTVTTSDPDGDAVTVTASTPFAGMVVDNGNGTWTYTPDPAFAHSLSAGPVPLSAEDSVTFTAYDGHGIGVLAQVSVTIPAANNAPALDIATTHNADGSTTFTLSTDDADGDSVTVTAADPVHGSIVENTDGTWTYTPDPEYAHQVAPGGGTDTVTFTATDGHGGVVVSAATATVPGTNNAPTNELPDDYWNPRDTGIVYGPAGFSDPDGDTLTYTVSTPADPAKGVVTVDANGWLYFTPTPEARHRAAATNAAPGDKVVTFSLTADDGHGGTITQDYTIKITTLNTAPTQEDSGPSIDRTTGVVTGSSGFSDADGDTLTYTVSSPTDKGTVTVDADGTYTFTPTAQARHAAAADDSSTDDRRATFAITVTDGHGGTATQIYTVHILSLNAKPTIVVTGIENADGTTTYTASTDDADGDTVTVTAGSPEHGSIATNDDGSWTYTPDPAYAHELAVGGNTDPGADTVVFVAEDGHEAATFYTATPSITPTNTAPVNEQDDELDTDEATGTISGDAGFSDPDGDTLTYTVSTPTTKGTVTVDENGVFTFTPTDEARHAAAAEDAPLSDKRAEFAITVDDGHGGTLTTTYRLRIRPFNQLPVLSVEAGAPNTTGAIVYTAGASDPDNDTVTVTAGTPQHGTITDNGDGTWTYRPDLSGGPITETLTFTADDGHGGRTTADLEVAYLAPDISVTSTPIDSTGSTLFTVSTATTSGGPVNVTVSTPLYGYLIDNGDGTYSYIKTEPLHQLPEGVETITFTASDFLGLSSSTDVSVTIPNNNYRPELWLDRTDNSDGTVTYVVGTSDQDGDPVTVTAIKGADYGSLVQVDDDTWVYTPYENPTRDIRLQAVLFTATDGFGGRYDELDTVRIPAKANTAPSAPNVEVLSKDSTTGATTYRVTSSDVDGDTVTITGGTPTTGVLVKNADGTFTYTPTTEFRHAAAVPGAGNTVVLQFTAADTYGGASTASYTATVTPSNIVPSATVSTTTDAATGAVTLTVTPADADGDTVTVTGTAGTYGTLVKNTNGTFTYTWNTTVPGTVTADTITLVLNDGHGGTVIVPTAVALNRPPTATVGQGSANATTGAVTLTVTASDPESSAVTITGATATNGTVVKTVNNVYTFTPTASYRHGLALGGATTPGSAVVTFTISDGVRTATVTTTVSVAPYNRVPTGSVTGTTTPTITITDADNDTLAITTTTTGTGMFISAGNGQYTFIALGGSGTGSITAKDNYGGTVTWSFASSSVPGGPVTWV